MGTIRTSANTEYRDYETDGVPASGSHTPSKAGIRTLFGKVEDSIAAVQLANAIDEKYETKALMEADTSQADGAMAIVFADPVTDNNGYYYWVDADSEWVRSAVLNPTDALAGAVADAEAEIVAATDVATAQVLSTPALGGFSTTTAGLAAAGEGQVFAVSQASGLGQDWYRDISGAAHFLYSRPGSGGQFIADLTVHERSAYLAVQYPWLPHVDIRWGDARIHNGAVAPNRSTWSNQPARTINAFTAGYFPNIGGSQTSPTHTALYTEGQTAGVDDAVHYSFGNNQILYLLRAPPTVTDVPDQTITEVFDYRRNAGAASDQTLQCGLSTSLETITATASWQTKMKEITWAGVGDIVIRTAAYTAEVDLARVFLWPGPAATVPAWATMNFVGGRRPFSFGDSLTMSGAAAVTGADAVGFLIYAKDYKTGGSEYDSALISHTFQIEDIDSAAVGILISTAEDDGHGTDDGDMQLALQVQAGFEGQLAPETWTTNTRGSIGVDCRFGPIIQAALWHRSDEGLKTIFVDGVAAQTVEEANSPFTASVFRAMANTDSHNVELTSGNVPGSSYASLIDNVPAGASVAQVEQLLRSQREKLRLDPSITEPIGFPFHMTVIGDSNDNAGNAGEWLNIIRAHNWLGAGYKAIPISNYSVGGAGIDNGTVSFRMQMDTGTAADNSNPECGALATIRSSLRIGKPSLTYLRGWTNNKDRVSADPDDLFADYEAVYEEVLAMGELSFLMIASPLAHKTESADPNFNGELDGETGGRFHIADLQAAFAAAHPNRVWFVDVTRAAYVGSTAEANLLAAGGTFQVDGKHLDPNDQGDIRMAAAHEAGFRSFIDYLASQGFG